MPNGWKLYSRQWAFWAPSIELTLHTTLHCSNLTLSFSPSLALNWEDGRSTCATYTLEHQPWSENQKCPMSVSWKGRYSNYAPHCTVRCVIRYLPKHTREVSFWTLFCAFPEYLARIKAINRRAKPQRVASNMAKGFRKVCQRSTIVFCQHS